ncbi:MAG: hypothetical protein ACOC33_00340 [bacterium]
MYSTIKEMENKNIKPKSIIISGEHHLRLKKYCRGKALKIGALIENLIDDFLNDKKTLKK